MPDDMELLAVIAACPEERYWIAKPKSLSGAGRNIFIFTSDEIKRIAKKRELVVQRYIPNPLLIEGYKVDVRIYVAITPSLQVFLYREGVAGIRTQPSVFLSTPLLSQVLFVFVVSNSAWTTRG